MVTVPVIRSSHRCGMVEPVEWPGHTQENTWLTAGIQGKCSIAFARFMTGRAVRAVSSLGIRLSTLLSSASTRVAEIDTGGGCAHFLLSILTRTLKTKTGRWKENLPYIEQQRFTERRTDFRSTTESSKKLGSKKVRPRRNVHLKSPGQLQLDLCCTVLI